jgi:hypothetical protein
MRHHFDWLAKQIGKTALSACGVTGVQDEITSETLYADLRHEPDPEREAERARLGLLGRLAASLCLIELYGHAPDAEEFRSCLAKHLTFWQERVRQHRKATAKARKVGQQLGPFVEPSLWIIAAGRPKALLKKLRPEPTPEWPEGVCFFGDDVLRVGIVVASELPCDRSTLLVRLMAGGPLLSPAITELAALPTDASERAVAEQFLLYLQQELGKKPRRTREEQEFVMTMQNTWENAREEGRQEGRQEGRDEGARSLLLRLLHGRFGDLPAAVVSRIAAARAKEIEKWGERVLRAQTLAEVLDEPS